MRIVFFDSHRFEREAFDRANAARTHELHFLEPRLTPETARLAADAPAVCAFVNDDLGAATLESLHAAGVQLVLLRSAGFNHVDLEAAARLQMPVCRVPAYSPHAVAEHAFALLLSLVRKIPRASMRVRDGNFTLDGLVGFDLYQKTFGVVGTGQIGTAAAHIARGFGCRVVAYDLYPQAELEQALGVRYLPLPELLAASDIVSLHIPLSPSTRHLIGRQAIAQMKPGAVLVNTGRGGLVDTAAMIDALKSGQLGGAALDVYEEEEKFFFRDFSGDVVKDDVLARLLTLPNVVLTAHQGFLTREALEQIAQTTLMNATEFEQRRALTNEVRPPLAAPARA